MGQSELNSIELPSEGSCVDAGKQLVVAILKHLPADRAFIVHLSGALGSGKTTLARGILRGAGVEGQIRSPTFTLVETYDTPANVEFVHIDLYRIGDRAEAEGLGLREYDRPGVIWLVEWPERAVIAPEVDIQISLTYRSSGRLARLSGQTAPGLEALNAAWPSAKSIEL